MAYKTILTVAASTDAANTAIPAAAQIALKADGHLDVLALGVDRTQIGYSYVGSGAVIIAAATERAQEEAHLVGKAATTALQAQTQALRSTLETAVSQIGALSEIVGSRARYADLVVLRKPYGEGRTMMTRRYWRRRFSTEWRLSSSCPTAG